MLFATESFAIGLDCPIRTAVFTSLTKFDGTKMRHLFPHEYSQAAGRAGRRGLDTVGHVVHCNNMFEFPYANDYQEILCGKPQQLISKFQMSYSVILNLLKHGKNKIDDFVQFVNKSMLYEELKKSYSSEQNIANELHEKIFNKEEYIKNLRTPYEVCEKYLELTSSNVFNGIVEKSSNKQRKNKERQLQTMKNDYKFIMADVGHIEQLNNLKYDYEKSIKHIEYCRNYIYCGVKSMCDLLVETNFIKFNNEEEIYEFMILGENASNIAEIHSLIISELLDQTNYFEEFSSREIVGILSVFCDIKVIEDYRSYVPQTNSSHLKETINHISKMYDKYGNLEDHYQVNSGENYYDPLVMEFVDIMQEWCDLENEQQCKYFVQTKLKDREVSLGDFAKGILKICTISKELMKISEKQQKATCMHRMSQIEGMILKFVATTQSLYV